jgi:type IV pilus assembly protein PilY1
MNTFNPKCRPVPKGLLSGLILLLMTVFATNTGHAAIAQVPLFLTTSSTPIVMLNSSKDHQLYFKVFDDYSDLDKDGVPETTYKHSIDYYGYFDSYKCYNYTGNRFEPSSITLTKYCSGLWSGNFLNWAGMTRIDTIRKILYGGLRSTDMDVSTNTSTTVSAPVISDPVVTHTVGPTVTSSTVGPTTVTTVTTPSPDRITSHTSCAAIIIPAATTTGPINTSTGPTTTSSSTAIIQGASTNSTPVTNTAGTTTTTTYNTTFDSTYDTVATTVSTATATTTTVTTIANGSCGWSDVNDNWRQKIKISTAVTTTKTTTTRTTTTSYKKTNSTTTTVTADPLPALTVLERSYLPNDAHSFAKFYNGADLNQLTPFSGSDAAGGITLCNTTVSDTVLSQNVTDAPLIRVAKGNFSLWAANERWQCRWLGERSALNSNSSVDSGISAASSNPDKGTNGLGSKDYIARVKVCDSALIKTENCKTYPTGAVKPIGLLQTYGDDDLVRFGMLTGSYGKNTSGGVLRKNVSSMTDEINVTTDGTFKSAPLTGGIINTLNKLRIHGYRHDDGTYFGVAGSDDCSWALNTFADGACSNWGNPQSEMFLESLRYLSNHAALGAYLPTGSAIDSSYIPDLTIATTNNHPILDDEWCAKLNIIQFNASTSSYDGNQLGSISDLTATSMNSLTNALGVGEHITGNSYFVGENGTSNNQLCTAKTVYNLSDAKGTCPDAPRLSGTYHIAGLAQFAHDNDIAGGMHGDQRVTTYGVALSPAIPKIVVPVPGDAGKTITLLPACQDSTVGGNCAIVDFKIVHQNCALVTSPVASASSCGKVYVNWEDSEQGGDFDQDEWGILTYSISSTQVTITTDVIAQSTPYKMGFGYILSGTTKDGFHAHSGINGYAYTDPQGTTACSNCTSGDAARSVTYTIGSSSGFSLQQPLFYAAKWGGFNDKNNNDILDQQEEWDSNADGIPDRYFSATDPGELASSLNRVLNDVIKTSASASAVAANSTRLDTGTQVFQAKFNSIDWSGQVVAYNVNTATGALTPIVSAVQGTRHIYTYDPSAAAGGHGVLFEWANLTATQQAYLNTLEGVNDGEGASRVSWLQGNDPGDTFRNRTTFLGDIINSDPIYVGNEDYGYGTLPSPLGSDYSAFRAVSRRPMLYVGANDGMLHGFDASGTAASGQEVFAYIPNVLFPELSKLTSTAYTHQYYVDGTAGVGDVYYASNWHTVLAGATGAGARAVFALDVTNPDGFGASSALWEFTHADDADLGYTLAQPSVVRMQNGQWAVIAANGYNSDNGHAVLFILDAETGAVLQKIDTGSGSPTHKNGLSSPIAVDTNNDHGVDTLYAGDLLGNLWKFTMSGGATSWSIPGNTPLFVACATSGASCGATDRQPITGKPNVGKVGAVGSDQNGVGQMVYFGTGKYYETGDNIVSPGSQVQAFYGLWDNGSAITDRASLQEQTIDFEGVATTVGSTPSVKPIRVVSNNTVCYAASSAGCTSSSVLKKGWALKLLKPVNIAEGERVVSFPLVRRGLVVFATVIPSGGACNSGGESRLMEVGALSGGEYIGGSPPFDVNGDGKVNDADYVMIGGVKHAPAGIDVEVGINKTPTVVESTTVDFKYVSGSSGNMGTVVDAGGGGTVTGGGGSSGIRRSWRQLK